MSESDTKDKKSTRKKFPIWIVFVAVAILLIGLTATSAWDYLYSLLGTESSGRSQLRVYAPDSTLSVYIDGEFKGRTSDGMLLLSDVPAQKHSIKLEREASVAGFYVPFERDLVFMEGTEVEIRWMAGPTVETSEGIVRYFRERPAVDSALRVFFVTYPAGASVKYDSTDIDPSALSVEIDDGLRHEITVEKTGFESAVFTIDAGQIGDVSNADLVIEVYLYQAPVLNYEIDSELE